MIFMGRKVKQLKNYSSEQIKAFIDNEYKYRIGLRLYAVYQLSKGKSSRSLEELYNFSFKQICNWANKLDRDGIEGLRDKPRSGRRPRLTVSQRQDLQGILLRSPEEFGYNTANWSAPLVRDYIQEQYQVEYKQANIYNLLHNLGFSYQRAKGIYPERDEGKRCEVKADIKKH
jgi:transposase